MFYKTKKELIEIYNLPLKELLSMATEIHDKNFGKKMDFCSLISAKTGKCSQNCKYCAQSSHYRTEIDTHPLVSIEEVKKAAISSKENGANKFSVVTSGKTPEIELNNLLEMIKEVNSIDGLECCGSLGILTKEQAIAFKKAGLKRYHHNINTCKSYHDKICTTHSYEDRIKTVNYVKEAGLKLCCGVIIGMGESIEQRVEMAMELREIKPDSIPLNLLYPIEGTPFESYFDKIDEENILRTIAMFRIAMPDISIRYAGGRLTRLSYENQKLGLKAGIDSILVGNLLTTIGIEAKDDLKMIEKVGRELV